VDDWAWKKGQTYGTILVDLEKRCPIELLPDRKEETLTAWLLTHPEIDVISRDRGGEYAAAARKGAPQAQQIADKFHILKNLRDGLKELMARKQKVLPEVEEVSSDGIPLPTGYATRYEQASRKGEGCRFDLLSGRREAEGKEGKRETKIDRPWQKVSSLGKRGVKMGRWTLSTETFRSRRGFVHLMQSTAPQPANREPGQIGTRAHRQ
jgi:hypothetical protein